MTRNEFLENGWKLEDSDEIWEAAHCMNYKEYKEYKAQQRSQAAEAMRDLKGMYAGAEALYEDTILQAVGEKFLVLFKKLEMIESCGVIQGRKLYAI